jgi:hypothetical protein
MKAEAKMNAKVSADARPHDRGAIHCGFIFNQDQLHPIAHSAPIAFELMRLSPSVRVSLLATTLPQFDYLRRALASHGLPDDSLQLIRLPAWMRGIAGALDALIPFTRVLTLLAHLDRFRALDVLVAPEKTSLLLRSTGGLRSLKFVHTRHGAGDRAIGFDRRSGEFDLVLMSGEKIRDRLQAAGLIDSGGYAIVGYPKFDACTVPGSARPRLFANNRPTVLYNPHCSPRLSSWFGDGLKVLEAFYRSDKYNLIFAPHVMLFRKRIQISLKPFRVAWTGTIPERYLGCPHILVDSGSERSTDMTYTEAADLYLGDVSSQIYEFLRRPRPCVFIDSHSTDWQGDGNFRHWTCGQVLSDSDKLIPAIDVAFTSHADYAAAQRSLFAYSIDLRETSSSRRGAEAILAFVRRTFPQRAPAFDAGGTEAFGRLRVDMPALR